MKLRFQHLFLNNLWKQLDRKSVWMWKTWTALAINLTEVTFVGPSTRQLRLTPLWATKRISIHLKRVRVIKGLPWRSGSWEPACQSGDTGSIPGPGRSHMLRSNPATHHSYWARALQPARQSPNPETTEPRAPGAHVLRQETPLQKEAPHRSKDQPPLATTRESPRAASKTQQSQKQNLFLKNRIQVIKYALW